MNLDRHRPAARTRRIRVRAIMLVGALILFGSRAFAADPQPGTQGSTLAPGDRVALTVFGQPELSGEFLVDGAGDLTLALLGAVPATDVTVRELQQRILERLADGYVQEPRVSLRVAELRPIYVVGDVRSPGTFPYRHGLSVLSALALAGGINVSHDSPDVLRSELAQAEERVSTLEAGRAGLLARRARLIAQRDGAREIAFPADLLASGSAYVAETLSAERDILRQLSDARARELDLLKQQAPRARAEADALAAQRKLERTQLGLIQAQLEDIGKLAQNGLARRATVVALQREEASIQGNIARQTADTARLQQVLGEIGLKIEELENGYRHRAVSELLETQVRLMEVEASLTGAREARDLKRQRVQLASGLLSSSVDLGEAATIVSYGRDGAVQNRAALEGTLLRPGDILRVEIGRARRGGSPGASRRDVPAIAPVSGVDSARR